MSAASPPPQFFPFILRVISGSAGVDSRLLCSVKVIVSSPEPAIMERASLLFPPGSSDKKWVKTPESLSLEGRDFKVVFFMLWFSFVNVFFFFLFFLSVHYFTATINISEELRASRTSLCSALRNYYPSKHAYFVMSTPAQILTEVCK